MKIDPEDRKYLFKNNKANSAYNLYKKTNLELADEPFTIPIRERYSWNTHLLQPFLKYVIGQEFILPIICGFFRVEKVQISGRIIKTGILSRRSRFYAGPRFLKRGIDEYGNIANEVETDLFTYEIERFSSKLLHFTNYLYV